MIGFGFTKTAWSSANCPIGLSQALFRPKSFANRFKGGHFPIGKKHFKPYHGSNRKMIIRGFACF